MKLSGRVWFDQGRGAVGAGRIALLEGIAEHGSITRAAKAMGMSYKAAWDAVDAMNNLADRPLVVRAAGGRGGGGTRLTDAGRRLVAQFRAFEAEYRRFLERATASLEDPAAFSRWMARFSMKTSARNQFLGRVTALKQGAVNVEVVLDIGGGDALVAVITGASAERLGLQQGAEVSALIKASFVILTPDEPLRTSARNRLCGVVVRCQRGAVDAEVVLELNGGKRLAAVITGESLQALGLEEGMAACALIKASHVILAVAEG